MKLRKLATPVAFLLVSTAAAALLATSGPASRAEGEPAARGPARAAVDDRTAWFRDAKFGLFIHWGVYSMIGREEWARTLLQIPREEYARIAEGFNPVHFDPDEWAALAKGAGVKYIVITSKHHDGFAIYDSAASDYDIMSAAYGRDILGLLADSCRKAGIPLGFYYSIMDWHHPDYLPRRDWETGRSAKGADFGRYMDFAVAQVTELVEKYDPAVLWFDGEWEHSNEEQRAFEIERLLLGLKPSLLINDRLFRREPGHGDFGTPENFVPATGVRNPDGSPRLWEACYTMNWNGWGYNRYETEFHSASQLIRQLVEIVSKGGNLLLNVGPQPDGRIQPEFVARLERMGEWLAANGEAIYGTTASVFERLPFFGRVTVKDRTLYVHVMGWPRDGKIVLPGLRTDVEKAYLLADRDKALRHRRAGSDVVISLPGKAPDPDASVVAVELKSDPVVDPYEIRPDRQGRVELPVHLADLQSEMGQRAYLDHFYRTTMLANWQNVNDYPVWEFTTDKAGTYEVLVSYASMWGGQASFAVEIDDQILAARTESSPSVYFPKTFSVGTVDLAAGEHTLRVKITCVVNNHAMNLEKVILAPAAK
jgi:alpha-L-fucosidase